MSIISNSLLFSQDPLRVWNIENFNNPAPGYLNFDYPGGSTFFLVDHYGTQLHPKLLRDKMIPFRFLKDGRWLMFGKKYFFFMDQETNLTDSIPYPNGYEIDFHDVNILKNGNLMALCYDTLKMDLSTIVQGGRKNANILSAVILEFDKKGNIVWKWKILDHFKITDATEDIDLTQPTIDYSHANSFCEDNDGNIVVSFRNLDEITKINRVTGQVIWRIGGSKCKNNQYTFEDDNNNGFIGFSHQHSVIVLPNNNILMYDNGNLRNPRFSRAVEYQIDETNKIIKKVWEYRNTPDLFASMVGNVARLSNGNTLINWGLKKITEVKPDNSIAMELVFGINNHNVYKAEKVFSNHDFVKKSITQGIDYNFDDSSNNTGITLKANSLNGKREISVEYHKYSPPKADFIDSNFSEIIPARWVLRNYDSAVYEGVIKIKNLLLDSKYNPWKLSWCRRNIETKGIFELLPTVFDTISNEIEADFTGFGEFVLVNHKLDVVKLRNPLTNSKETPLDGTFSWEKLSGASKYQIQVSKNIDFSNIMMDKTILYGMNNYDYQKFETNTKYFWRVRALNIKDTSEWSEVFNFETVKFSVPILSAPENNSFGNDINTTLKWNHYDTAYKYIIIFSDNPDFIPELIHKKEIITNYYEIKNLLYNHKYFWKVKAYKGTDTTEWSEIWNFTTILNSPELLYPQNSAINISINDTISFDPVENIDSYEIEISEYSNFSNISIRDTIFSINIYEFKNLKYFRKYYWRIRAVNDEGNFSNWTSSWYFTTKLSPPKLISPDNNDDNISVISKFNWDINPDAESYHIQISDSDFFSNIFYDIDNLTENSFQPYDLMPNSNVFWRVKCLKDSNQSDWSEIRKFHTGSNIQMAKPKLSYPKNNSVNNNFGILSWIKTSRHLKYNIQLAEDNTFDKLVIDTSINHSFYLFYSNLGNDKNYYWRVKAYSMFDSSDWSDSWILITDSKSDNLYLFRPRNEQNQVQVDGNCIWFYNPEAESYQFQLSDKIDFTNIILDSSNIIENSFKLNKLKENNTYFWRVRYSKENKLSNWSAIWQFTTFNPDSLSRPQLINPKNFQNSTKLAGFLIWNKVADAEEYELSFSKDGNFFNEVTKVTTKDTIYQYSKLDYNSFYYWRIAAINGKSRSKWSDVFSFITEMKSPLVQSPQNGESVPVEGKLSWSVEEDIAVYHCQISPDSSFNTLYLDTVEISELSINYQLLPNFDFFWRVQANTTFNSSSWSKTAHFKTLDPSDINETEQSDFDLIFPNPVDDFINLNNSKFIGKHYKIYNLTGIILLEGNYSESINIKELPKGTYFLFIGNSIIKFIKQ